MKQEFMSKIIPLFNTEYDLARELQKNNSKAQTQAYQKYAPKFLGICMRYIKNEMEAEDVMIEAFMKIFDKVKQFNFQGSFEGWMRRLVVNEALMAIRNKKVSEVDLDKAEYETSNLQLDSSIEVNDLLKMINNLPTGYRTVFNLYAIEGYSHAEIAKMQNITEGTSKSQLSRARAFLQEELAKYEKENQQNTK